MMVDRSSQKKTREIVQINLAAIKTDRRRILPVCQSQALALYSESKDLLACPPITVRRNDRGDDYILVNGGHRLAAAKALGLSTIAAEVVSICSEKIAEIERTALFDKPAKTMLSWYNPDLGSEVIIEGDSQKTVEPTKRALAMECAWLWAESVENMSRVGLTVLADALQLRAWKQLYVALYPQTGRGGDVKSQEAKKLKKIKSEIFRFDFMIAQQRGCSASSIAKRLKLVELVGEEYAREIVAAGLPLADQRGNLVLLAKRGEKKRRQILDLLAKKPTRDFQEVLQAVDFQVKDTRQIASNDDGNDDGNDDVDTVEEILERREKYCTKEISRIVGLFGNKDRFNLYHRRELVRRLLAECPHTFIAAVKENGYFIEKKREGAA